MANTITKKEHKDKIKSIKKAVWQYLLDHSSKDNFLGTFKFVFVLRDEDHFWEKVYVREKGLYSRKDIEVEQEILNEMIRKSSLTKMMNAIRQRKLKRFNKSKDILDIIVRVLLKKLSDYREYRIK